MLKLNKMTAHRPPALAQTATSSFNKDDGNLPGCAWTGEGICCCMKGWLYDGDIGAPDMPPCMLPPMFICCPAVSFLKLSDVGLFSLGSSGARQQAQHVNIPQHGITRIRFPQEHLPVYGTSKCNYFISNKPITNTLQKKILLELWAQLTSPRLHETEINLRRDFWNPNQLFKLLGVAWSSKVEGGVVSAVLDAPWWIFHQW